MAYDDALAARVRDVITPLAEAGEIKMFGGLTFMVNTHMAVGLVRDQLMLNVGRDGVDGAVAAGASPMRMGERVMAGMVSVPADAVGTQLELESWVQPAVMRALAKPRKKPRQPKQPVG